jgi:hypothetical protein
MTTLETMQIFSLTTGCDLQYVTHNGSSLGPDHCALPNRADNHHLTRMKRNLTGMHHESVIRD